MVKRKRYTALAALLVGMVLAVLGVLYGMDVQNYVRINGVTYDRYAETLDLSGRENVDFRKLTRFYNLKEADLRGTGLSVQDFELLHQALGCKIFWLVPFQGQYLDPETTTALQITHLSPEDVRAAQYLTALREVDATRCRDLDMLLLLKQGRENLRVDYRVELGGTAWEPDTTCLLLPELDTEELEEKLTYLPEAAKIVVTGEKPALSAVLALEQKNIELFWRVRDTEVPLGSRHTEITLGADMTAQEIRDILSLLPNAKTVGLRGSRLPGETIAELCGEFPERFFLWDVPFEDRSFPSDAEEIELSGLQVESVRWVEDRIAYMPRLRKVVMNDCGLSDAEMDALDGRYENIRFVWTVYIGRIPVRTDAEFFAPVVTGSFVYESEMAPLRYCRDIVAIDLGHMAIRSCTWAENMPNLQYLILADTGVTDISPLASCKNLIFLELFMTAVRDYSPLLECPKLEDLNLCYTYGSAEPVREMTWLRRLWWDGNPYETRGLEEYLPVTQCDFTSGSSTGDSWRLGQRYKEQRDILGMPYLVG